MITLLVMAVAVAVLATAFIVSDGEPNWQEGALLDCALRDHCHDLPVG
ncbi:hypothetical protein [Actinoplanes sp. NPDC049681]